MMTMIIIMIRNSYNDESNTENGDKDEIRNQDNEE